MANERNLLSPEKQEQLIGISGTAYSISGYPPTTSTWELTADQITSIIKNHTKAWLDDVKDVTLDYNPKTGSLHAYVWIPKRSKHICDTELKANDSAINRTMTKYSKEMKEYLEKFCAKDRRRLVSEEKGMDLAGIEVLIENFMYIEFDINGYEYAKQFGDSYKKKTDMQLKVQYDRVKDGRYEKFLYLTVEKKLRSAFKTQTPKPKKSYNA